MQNYNADMHIHSVLSPCGGLEMSPKSLMEYLVKADISIAAITDHNTIANCPAYEEIAAKYNITFIYGIEIQTAEEIHIVALFDNKDEAISFNGELYNALPPLKNSPDFFGDQVVIDANENIIRIEDKALINSIAWSLEETVSKLRKYDTFIFPAHIDADTFSIIGQLGFIPSDLDFDALGITAKCNLTDFLLKHSYLEGKTFIRNSDAHYLNQIGSGFTSFYIEKPTLNEMRFACQNRGGRKCVVS